MQIMRTRGFLSEVPETVQARIMLYALRRINKDKPNWVVFYPPEGQGTKLDGSPRKTGKPYLEDEGRSLIVPNWKGLPKKVFAILDDFGSVEALRENMGQYAPPNLSSSLVVTFLLAEEY